jgi:hypothetical protein
MSASSFVSSSHSSGLGLPPRRKVVFRPTMPASPQWLRASTVCSRSPDAVGAGRRLHDHGVQREGLLGLGDAVVGHHQAALDPVLVHELEEVGRAREVVDDRLHGVVDPVEGPRLDLADVAVAVDHVALDAVGQGHAASLVRW